MEPIIVDNYGQKTSQKYDQISSQLFWAYGETLQVMTVEALYVHGLYWKKPLIKVLDLGAGTGNLSCVFAREIQKLNTIENQNVTTLITLVDMSEDMLDLAQQKVNQIGTQSCQYQIVKLQDWDSSEKYDLVMSSYAIHHLNEIEKHSLFGKVKKCLSPEGIFIYGDRMHLNEDQFGYTENQAFTAAASKLYPALKSQNTKLSYNEAINFIHQETDRDGDQPSSRNFILSSLKQNGFKNIRAFFEMYGCCVVSGQ